MLPLFLDLTGRTALVVGGGPIGRRKARAVLDAGGRVRLVCLEAKPTGVDDIDWHQEPYHQLHLDGVALAFAAATAEVNALVEADARRRGVLFNGADFHLAATLRRGELVVAFGTGGAAPVLAQRLRDKLDAELDDAFAAWVALLAELRQVVVNEPCRRGILDCLTEWHWLDRLRSDGIEATRAAMLRLIESSKR